MKACRRVLLRPVQGGEETQVLCYSCTKKEFQSDEARRKREQRFGALSENLNSTVDFLEDQEQVTDSSFRLNVKQKQNPK